MSDDPPVPSPAMDPVGDPSNRDRVPGPQRASPAAARTLGDALFVPAVTIYAAGLIFWLVLGLLPTLASVFAPVHHWVEALAASSSPLAAPAGRILDANQSMPGMEMEASNTGSVVLAYTFSVLNLVLGLILAARRSRDLVPRLLAFALLGTAATFNKPSHAVFHIIGEPWPVKVVHFSFHIVSGVTYLWAVLLFPDGHLPRQLRLEGKPLTAVVVIVTAVIAVVSWRSSFIDHPLFFVVFFGVVVSLAGIGPRRCALATLALRPRNGGPRASSALPSSPLSSPDWSGWPLGRWSLSPATSAAVPKTSTRRCRPSSRQCSPSCPWCCSSGSCVTGSGTSTGFSAGRSSTAPWPSPSASPTSSPCL